MELSHIDKDGSPKMVDVGGKDITPRYALARGYVRISAEALELLKTGAVKKGDVLTTAKIAGITGAKRTSELIPMCHNVILDNVDLKLEYSTDGVIITASAKTLAKTGVEMEALTAVTVAALTVYDMLKAVDRGMEIGGVRLLEKDGGKSGRYVVEEL